MNKRMIMLMAAALALLSARGQTVDFPRDNQEHPYIEINLSNNHTSLNKVFVLYQTDGVGMSYTATSDATVVWKTYDSNSWANPQEITGIRHDGLVTTLDQVIPNTGYVIEEGSTPHYYWVVNYADYYMELNDMFLNNEAPCSLITFNIDGHADAIPYYNINGNRQVLDREIKLKYKTYVWNDSIWEKKPVVETFAALDQGVEITPPLCNTNFVLTGDRFLERWGLTETIEIEDFETHAVACKATAYFLDDLGNYLLDDQGKVMKLEGELTGGSSPVRILFNGSPTEGVVYRKWEMATDADFENVILQYNQDDVDYTFNDAGTYYMRYMVANYEGTCEDYSETYTINVSESQLGEGPRGDLPNVFSPGSTEGINDVWKVTYKSLVEFHCWIYNRWGNLVYEYTDPDGGWDGTYRGKLVDTGVYYYVVTALGSDGVRYKKRGDITILRYKGSKGTMSDDTGGGFDTGGF